MDTPTRKPAVSGMFYPGTAQGIQSLIASIMSSIRTEKKIDSDRVLGMVLPHAGYIYSGKTALKALKYISKTKPQTFIILGPNHESFPPYSAVFPEGEWVTPLGTAKVAKGICSSLLSHGTEIVSDPVAHKHEHSIEVQIPLLQYLMGGDFTFCPVILGNQDKEVAQALGKSIAAIEQAFTLIASSDLTHYENLSSANRKDKLLLDAVISLDTDFFYSVLNEYRISSCGYGTIAALMEYTKIRGGKIELIDYTTSFDRSGDSSSVVGYASLIAYGQP